MIPTNLLTYFNNTVWLLSILALREIKQRYSSTILGYGWILFQPLCQMLIYTFIFSKIINLNISNYSLFVIPALVSWNFFALTLKSATDSIINSRDLVKKIAFPRILIPLASILAQIPVIIFSLTIIGIISIIKFNLIRIDILLLSFCILILLTFGLSLITSALQVYFRDITFIIDLTLLIWFYLTPIVYPSDLIPQKYLPAYSLNPLFGIVNGLRYSFTRAGNFETVQLIYPGILSILILIFGLNLFFKRSKLFADWL